MHFLSVEITKLMDWGFPIHTESEFTDMSGYKHIIHEKLPVICGNSNLLENELPAEGSVCCEIVEQWQDEKGRYLLRINTEHPWGIETVEGETVFVVLASAVTEVSD